MSLRRILSRTISAQFRAASSSAVEFASPRFLPGLGIRRCFIAFSVEIFEILLFLEQLPFCDVLFRFPRFFRFPILFFGFFLFASRFARFCFCVCFAVCVCFCFSVLWLFLFAAVFVFRFNFVFFRFPLSANFDIFLGDTRAPRARDRDGGDGRAGKTAKFR